MIQETIKCPKCGEAIKLPEAITRNEKKSCRFCVAHWNIYSYE